eukprot:CAMPEP_0197649250 /NCGR_PEP_ID=MMETSP1338-20131121/28240_1 /TAXON_ID=43686 ORGANISM="Pelagodinium beii, Strain RCC1491" /NCGR_SAMPLE_ID=MMETSP1338 /ASSEMBLY_ACC=CAM_ASM_000754 /LENGTH=681 /DNA_ID=CAMNT_0043223393 /DNA_START=75 /DNA_END=2117 /DNA_ORIENTATION=+
MWSKGIFAIVAAATSFAADGSKTFVADFSNSNANPIRKVVGMMQKMAEKIEAEGEKEAELYEKFECYCKSTSADLEKSIESASVNPVTQEDIDAKKAKIKTLEAEVEKIKADKIAEENTVKSAEAQRGKEHEHFVEETTEENETVKAVGSAVHALDAGTGAALLQAKDFDKNKMLRALDKNQHVTFGDKQRLTSFLSGSETEPDTGFVKGTLSEIGEETEAEVVAETKEEVTSEHTFEEVETSKKTEISSLLSTVQRKMESIGKLKVDVVNMERDLENSGESLADNKKMLADLTKNCAEKAGDWEERKKARAAESLALQDTIKMLNSDESLDMFRNRAPSLIQVAANREQVRSRALDFVAAALHADIAKHPELNFLALALSGKQADFKTVLEKIDSMIALIKKEGEDDESKVEYCKKQFSEVEDKSKLLTQQVSTLKAEVAENKEAISKIAEEIVAVQAGVKGLDESVAKAGEARKSEHAEYQETMSSNSAAVDLLVMAKNRLNKFYNPDLAPPEPTTKSPYDLSFFQEKEEKSISRHMHMAAAPPTWEGGVSTQGQASNGVLHMIDTLSQDIEKEMTVAKVEEQNAQKEYEETLEDAAKKRSADVALVQEKTKTKSDLEGDLNDDSTEVKGKAEQLSAASVLTANLHQECDWIMQNIELRSKAREEEKDNLLQAKTVLSG